MRVISKILVSFLLVGFVTGCSSMYSNNDSERDSRVSSADEGGK